MLPCFLSKVVPCSATCQIPNTRETACFICFFCLMTHQQQKCLQCFSLRAWHRQTGEFVPSRVYAGAAVTALAWILRWPVSVPHGSAYDWVTALLHYSAYPTPNHQSDVTPRGWSFTPQSAPSERGACCLPLWLKTGTESPCSYNQAIYNQWSI